MCSIYGVFIPDWSRAKIPYGEFERILGQLDDVRELAKDRGRDGHGEGRYMLRDGALAILGNWRAAPTTELEHAPPQPYGGVVHNGTIANDLALGRQDGEVDSGVLGRVLNRSSITEFAESLGQIQGSFALAAVSDYGQTLYLATNYKPIYYYREEDGTTFFASMERHLAPVVPRGQRAARVSPYSVLDLRTLKCIDLPRPYLKRALVIASAGLDSTVAATKMKADGWEIALLHFQYGCNAQDSESYHIHTIAAALDCPLYFQSIDYSDFKGLSPLFDPKEKIQDGIPGAEFAHEWVPARNLLMIAHAVAFAEANLFAAVVLGGNLEESGAYPDNEEEFTYLLDAALDYAVGQDKLVRLLNPLGNLMKHEIVKLGLELKAPMDLTWSCYHHGDHHCGVCGPCYMRKTAFARNGVDDPVMEKTDPTANKTLSETYFETIPGASPPPPEPKTRLEVAQYIVDTEPGLTKGKVVDTYPGPNKTWTIEYEDGNRVNVSGLFAYRIQSVPTELTRTRRYGPPKLTPEEIRELLYDPDTEDHPE